MPSPRRLPEQMEEATERHEQLEAFNRFLMKQRKLSDKRAREIGTYWYNLTADEKDIDQFTFSQTRIASVQTFLKKLPEAKIYEAVDIVFGKRFPHDPDNDGHTFRYFCGVCWGMIRQGEEDSGE